MTIKPFRPFIKISDHNLIVNFWQKIEEYNKPEGTEKTKHEINEIIKEMKYRDLKLSRIECVYKILF